MATQNVDPIALSSVYLKALGPQYDTPYNRRVIAAWMKLESGNGPNGTVAVHGYNALNWTTPALTPAAQKLATGTWSNPGHEFPTYDTPQAAGAAFADIMNHNFTNIRDALQANGNQDPAAVVAGSAWVHGWNSTSPSYSLNSMNNIINGLSGVIKTPLVSGGFGGGSSGGGGGGAGGNTTGFIDPVTKSWNPAGFDNHLLTAADADELDKELKAAGYLSNDPGGISGGILHDIMLRYVGKPWNQTTANAIAAEFSQAAVNANVVPSQIANALPKVPALTDLANIGQTLAAMLTHIVPLSAILLGVVFMLFGGYIIYRSSDQPSYDQTLIGQVR